MNIEVGEYIRTKDGIIAKLEDIQDEGYYWFDRVIYCRYSEEIDFLTTEELPKYIVKHSKSIISLIEPGDYVNGKYVYKNGEDFSGYKCLHMESSEVYACEDFLYEKDIKTIVTKQQFSNMEYRL